MAISITPSPFGSVTVTLDGELGGVLSASILATSNSVLDMAIGTPGPAGEAGEPGANGQNGVGVAAGGLTNQVLVKLSNDDFDTGWANGGAGGDYLPLSGGTMSGTIFLPSLRNLLNTDLTVTAYNDTGAGTNFIHTFDAFDGTFALATNGGGLIFPDATVQTTAGLPLTGGTMANGSTILVSTTPDIDNQGTKSTFNSNGFSAIYYNDGGAEDTLKTNYGHSSIDHTYFDNPRNFHLNQNGVYGIGDGEVSWGVGIGGVTYPDATVQVTAGLPLTGGTMSGDLTCGGDLNLDQILKFTNINNGITFGDDSVQTTAWLGYTGTTSEYIRGDGSLYTFPPVGDRYLTSSTTTLTVDSGNGKTMTVGTGLSYSPQQDITVSYNTANHMHGTVLTYNSTTGVMTWDSNTHSGSGTYSSWEVNVGGVAGAILPVGGTAGQVLAKVNSTNFNTEWVSLGSASTLASSAVLQTANNLSDLSSSSTARSNLGLGSMATQSTSAYLSSSAIASTYQTQAGMSAYLSTSAAASTYLTQSNASSTYLTQSNAASTYIGTSAYATTAQALAGTSTTTVINPSTLLEAKYFQGFKYLSMVTWTSATSGAGSFGALTNSILKNIGAPTSVTGYAYTFCPNYNATRGSYSSNLADFTKRTIVGGRFIKNNSSTDTNTIFRFSFGKYFSGTPVGEMTTKGIGFRQIANSALELQVHNGTSLYSVNSTFTPTVNQAFDAIIIADGGTATLYVNGSSVASSANAPSSTMAAGYGSIACEAQNLATITGTSASYASSDIFVQTNL